MSAERRSASVVLSARQALDLTILYEDGEDGFILASIPAVPGVLSQGRDRAEARENVLDALALMLSPSLLGSATSASMSFCT
ncbi:MAG TPA: type II toxin-antitoxin system HicB family antitoxin [Solirubrobacterales bacterium]|nr:type II toxin-antitoxin system HicB family antitoxin [Solirubrobacterales bacterium]